VLLPRGGQTGSGLNDRSPNANRPPAHAAVRTRETAMVVGIGVLTFRLHDCRSLKAKRKVVKSMIARIRNQFNITMAEVGANDVYQRAEIGFALVGNDHSVINSKMDKVINMAEDLGLAELVDTDLEIMHV
jgi:uncharacterized protein YlxP (DUF503 family)